MATPAERFYGARSKVPTQPLDLHTFNEDRSGDDWVSPHRLDQRGDLDRESDIQRRQDAQRPPGRRAGATDPAPGLGRRRAHKVHSEDQYERRVRKKRAEPHRKRQNQ